VLEVAADRVERGLDIFEEAPCMPAGGRSRLGHSHRALEFWQRPRRFHVFSRLWTRHALPVAQSECPERQNGFQVDCGVNFKYPTLAPSRTPSPDRIGTKITSFAVNAVIPKPPIK
jgi:hypothetical protein